MKLIKIIIPALLLYTTISAKGLAADTEIQKIITQNKLQQNGQSILIYPLLFMNFEVYEMTLHSKVKANSLTELLKQKGPKVLHFRFLRDVKRKYLHQAWDDSLDDVDKEELPGLKVYIEKLKENTPDGIKGTTLTFVSKNDDLKIFVQDKHKETLTHPRIAETIFGIWIGPKTVDKRVSKELLGVNK